MIEKNKKCMICEKEFISKTKKSDCCSKKCRGVKYNRIRTQLRREKRKKEFNICIVCEKKFKAKRSHKIVCSVKCRLKRNKDTRKPIHVKECVICKKTFKTIDGRQMSCSLVCARKITHFETVRCTICKKSFKKNVRYVHFYCSTECKNKSSNIKRQARRKVDPWYKLRCNMSSSIRRALKRHNISKSGTSCLDYLPYTIEELKHHLESLFEPWMSWENHGNYCENKKTWHIDHITPQFELPYDSMEHPNFQKSWALENLRPLLAIENLTRRKNYREFG